MNSKGYRKTEYPKLVYQKSLNNICEEHLYSILQIADGVYKISIEKDILFPRSSIEEEFVYDDTPKFDINTCDGLANELYVKMNSIIEKNKNKNKNEHKNLTKIIYKIRITTNCGLEDSHITYFVYKTEENKFKIVIKHEFCRCCSDENDSLIEEDTIFVDGENEYTYILSNDEDLNKINQKISQIIKKYERV